jgi:DUF1009 family protein
MSTSPNSPKTIGLIAGSGRFPLMFARAARARGIRVVAAAVRGDTSILIRFFADEAAWFSVGEFKKLFGYFRSRGVSHVMMAGQIDPDTLFRSGIAADDEYQALFKALRDRRCDTIFGAIAQRLKAEGMELLDSTLFIKDLLAPRGTLTRRAPTKAELEDIEFGMVIARQMGALDIGQTVVIKGRAIVAIEAMEGTDRCIVRGARIARQGAVVVKMSKPGQDLRFDVPVIGPGTIAAMKKFKASCLAIEAARTIILDRDRTVRLADKAGISIVGA